MGEMNLLQSKWDGKVGQLVGAKWKNKATVHAYTKPADAQSAQQLKQRAWFKPIQKISFLFASELKGLTNVSYKNMGLGNSLMKFNKGINIRNGENKWYEYHFVKKQLRSEVHCQYSSSSTQVVMKIILHPAYQFEPLDELFMLYYNETKQDLQIEKRTTPGNTFVITKDEKWKGAKYFWAWGRAKVNGIWKYTDSMYQEIDFNP